VEKKGKGREGCLEKEEERNIIALSGPRSAVELAPLLRAGIISAGGSARSDMVGRESMRERKASASRDGDAKRAKWTVAAAPPIPCLQIKVEH